MSRFVTSVARAFIDVSRGFSTFPTEIGNAVAHLLLGGPSDARSSSRRASYDERIDQITRQLRQSGTNAQQLLRELDAVMKARQQQLYDAQANLLRLQLEESEVEERVQALKAVKPESAEAIHALLNESLEERDKRSGRRDWIIFAAGVIVSVVLTLIFQAIFGS